MFDPRTETPITLKQATELPWLPARRRGKRPAHGTLASWCLDGLGSPPVKLEHLYVGETLCTSEEALVRFFQRLAMRGATNDTPTPADAARALSHAQAALAAAGI